MIQNDSAKNANEMTQAAKDSSLAQDTSFVKDLVDDKMNQFESTAEKIKSFANIDLTILDLVYAIVIIVILYALLTGLRKILRYQIEKNNLHHGNIMAVYKIIKYFTIVIGTMMVLNALGFNTTVLLTSSAALFIGLGLGIQTLFRDIVSGFVILFSKSIRIGDVVQVGDLVGQVKEITLRVTKILTRSDIDLIVPNSKFVEENVINWSLDNPLTRFDIEVGVAYGSDVKLVTDILNNVADEHDAVTKAPKHFVRFENFGDSALIFKIYFWSSNVFRIENVKSDIRYRIDEEFRKNNITIPFPQRTVWMEK
jgi:small-conductance mechanosensitive channel